MLPSPLSEPSSSRENSVTALAMASSRHRFSIRKSSAAMMGVSFYGQFGDRLTDVAVVMHDLRHRESLYAGGRARAWSQ